MCVRPDGLIKAVWDILLLKPAPIVDSEKLELLTTDTGLTKARDGMSIATTPRVSL